MEKQTQMIFPSKMKNAIIYGTVGLISYWVTMEMGNNEMSGMSGFIILLVSMTTAFYLTEKNI